MNCLDYRDLSIRLVNILDTKMGKKFLCENKIYQNFSMEKYLKLNHKSSRFGRTLKRKRYDDMIYSDKQLNVIDNEDKDDFYEKVGKLLKICIVF